MLVLARKVNEALTIEIAGIVIRVKICDVDRGRVKVGVQAPKDTKIMREELGLYYKPSPNGESHE